MGMKELAEKKKALDEEMRREGKAAMLDELKGLFEKHPGLKGVRWSQYTPYFNDGDACMFSVNEVEAALGDNEDFRGAWELTSTYGGRVPSDLDREIAQSLRDVSSLMVSDVMLAAFGDHVRITATRDGVDVEECSHD